MALHVPSRSGISVFGSLGAELTAFSDKYCSVGAGACHLKFRVILGISYFSKVSKI